MSIHLPDHPKLRDFLRDQEESLPDHLNREDGIAWSLCIPYFALHILPLVALGMWGMNAVDLTVLIAVYLGGMFFITAGYHRYFSHRTFKTSRALQFVLAVGAQLTLQKGVLWWAALHRHHHKHSDSERDIHSPRRGFYWSHSGWVMSTRCDDAPMHLVRDLAKYPELRFLDRHHWLPAAVFSAVLSMTLGPSALIIGYFLGVVLLWHATYAINSVAHVFGSRRYETNDNSRNSLMLALLTHGEGWHNNHHHYPQSVRQGFFWWEIDITYYVLKVMSWCGLVWKLKMPPERAINAHLNS